MSERWLTSSKRCRWRRGFPISILLVLLLFPVWGTSEVYADGQYNNRLEIGEPFLSAQKKAEMEQALREADFADHLMAGWMLQLMNSIELHSVESLVFGSPGAIWWDQKSYGKMLYGTFQQEEMEEIIQPAIQLFLLLFVVGLCGAILYSTLKIGANPHNPNTKYEFAENVKSWFISGIFFASYPTILDLIFGFNESIRLTFYEWSDYEVSFSYIGDTAFFPEKAFGSITLAFVEFIIVAYLNFIYLARKFVLMLLIVIGPAMGIWLFFTRLRGIAGTWFKEMAGSLFIQSIHAILLFMMVTSTGYLSAGSFAKLAWLFLLIPVSGMLGQWLGMNQGGSRIEQNLQYIGLGSISSMSRLTREGMILWRNERTSMAYSSEAHEHQGWQHSNTLEMNVLAKAGSVGTPRIEKGKGLVRDTGQLQTVRANEQIGDIKIGKYGDTRKPPKLL